MLALALALPLALPLALQSPKTLQDLEIAKASDFHNLPKIHLELSADGLGPQNSMVMSESISKDGSKWHASLVMPDGTRVEQIDDGVRCWYIFHDQKKHWEVKDATYPPFDAKREILAPHAGNFKLNLSSTDSVQFAIDPMPTIASIESVQEGDDPLRKVVIYATGSCGGHLTMTQWFLRDKWITKRFELTAENKDGKFRLFGRATALDLHPNFGKGEFVLDPKRVSGYQEMDTPLPANFPMGG